MSHPPASCQNNVARTNNYPRKSHTTHTKLTKTVGFIHTHSHSAKSAFNQIKATPTKVLPKKIILTQILRPPILMKERTVHEFDTFDTKHRKTDTKIEKLSQENNSFQKLIMKRTENWSVFQTRVIIWVINRLLSITGGYEKRFCNCTYNHFKDTLNALFGEVMRFSTLQLWVAQFI